MVNAKALKHHGWARTVLTPALTLRKEPRSPFRSSFEPCAFFAPSSGTPPGHSRGSAGARPGGGGGVCLSLFVSLLFCFSISGSVFPSRRLSFSPSLLLSFCPSLILSYSPCLFLSFSPHSPSRCDSLYLERETKRKRDKEKERHREREKASRCTKRISAAKTEREVARGAHQQRAA
jgi:hypothetical protein